MAEVCTQQNLIQVLSWKHSWNTLETLLKHHWNFPYIPVEHLSNTLETPLKLLAGLHKVKRCLQEFFDFLCACSKKHRSALSHATFKVRIYCFHTCLYLLHSYSSVYFPLMYNSTLQMTILTIVSGKPKMCLQQNLVDCADFGGLTTWNALQSYLNTLGTFLTETFLKNSWNFLETP